MKNNIDSNFAIAILALVAACVALAFILYDFGDDLNESNNVLKKTVLNKEVVKKMSDEKEVVSEGVNGEGVVLRQPSERVFVSEEYGFRFNHRNDWFVERQGEKYLLSAYRPEQSEDDIRMSTYFIRVTKGQAIDEYVAQRIRESSIGSDSVQSNEEFRSGKNEGRKIVVTADIGLDETIYLFEGDGNLYEIMFFALTEDEVGGAEMIAESFDIE